MRKFVVIFIAITCLSQLLVAQSGLRPRGDVNCDWEVTVSDINAVIDSIMSGAKYHSLYAYATDVNGDKEITVADAVLLARFVSEDTTLTEEEIYKILIAEPDYDDDGLVTILDVTALLKTLGEA